MFNEQTEAFCNLCKCSHPARLYEADNKIWGTFDCPQNGTEVHEISSNAAIYLKIRNRCFVDVTREPDKHAKTLMHVIPITDACNFNCTVCKMNAKPSDKANYLSVDEILKRARQAKAEGGKYINLYGGEPTLHPELFDILDALKEFKFNVGVLTNGLIVGRQPSFAHKLKQHGATRLAIQFDSLNEETLKKFGRSYLEEKKQAIEYGLSAGLLVALNCLVTRDNLDELPELIQFAADAPPNLYVLAFLSCAPVGHLAIDPEKIVGREEMIHKIMGSYKGFSIVLNDFSPPPTFLPFGLETHPDCFATARYVRDNGRIIPLTDYINLDRLYRWAAKHKYSSGFIARYIVPVIYFIASIRKGRFANVVSLAFRYALGKSGIGLLNIGATNHNTATFQDMNKTSRCLSKIHTSQGAVTGNQYFFHDESFPGSRLNEQKRGTL